MFTCQPHYPSTIKPGLSWEVDPSTAPACLKLFWKRLETIFEKNIRPTSNLQIVPECLQHQVPYHVLYMKKVTFSRKKITKHGQNVVKRGLNIIPALTRKSPVLAIFLHYEQQKHTKVPQSLFIFLYRRLENGQLKLVCG